MTTPSKAAGRDTTCDKNHCHGRRRQAPGEVCHRPAGWGTEHPGIGACKLHGGSTKNHQTAAKTEMTRRAAAQWVRDAAPITNPAEALLNVASEINGFKDYLADRVSEIRAESWRYSGAQAEQLRAEISLYERALDRTARVLVDVNKLDLEAKRDAFNQQHGALLAGAVQRILDALDLTEQQRRRVPEVVPAVLRAIEQGAA